MIDFKLFRKYCIIIFLASLCLNLPMNAKVKGKVIDIYGEPIEATIYAISDLRYEDSIKTINGEFEIEKAKFLLAIPDDTIHIPGYYKKGEIVVLQFIYASEIQTNNSEDIEIILDTVKTTKGSCMIYGKISVLEGCHIKSKKELTQYLYDQFYMFFFVLNSENKLVKYLKHSSYLQSNEPDGTMFNYLIDDLDTGEYKLFIDAVCFYNDDDLIVNHDTIHINLTNGNQIHEENIDIVIISSVEESENIKQIKLYPNPLERYLNLSFASKFLSYKIRIYDILGNEVFSSEYISNSEENNLQLDLKQLQSGTYYLKIEGGDEFATVPFVIRK